MKLRNLLFGAGLFTLLLIVFSCRPASKQTPYANMRFDSIQINSTERLVESDTASPTCALELTLVYPVACDSAYLLKTVLHDIIYNSLDSRYTDKPVPEAVAQYQADYVSNYRKDLTEVYMDSKGKADNAENQAWFSYYQKYDVRPLTDNPKYLIYCIRTHEYRGGAHGMYNTNYLNFDPQTGHLITLQDLLADGFEPALNELLLKQLMADFNCANLDELQEQGLLMDIDMFPSRNFRLGTTHIHFLYNVYEIAPYSMGEIEISIPYDALGKWLKLNP